MEADLADKNINIHDIFKPNQLLSLFVKDPETLAISQYQSHVDHLNPGDMEILAPTRLGVQIFLNKDDDFLIRVVFENEVYEFKSSYLYKITVQEALWVVQTPHDGRKLQQRSGGRVAFSTQVKAKLANKSGTPSPSTGQGRLVLKEVPEVEGEAQFLVSKDISAGGIKLASKLPYSLGDELALSFEIPEYGEVKVLGVILRVQVYRQENALIFFNAVRFTCASPEDFLAINDFIFKKQYGAI